jgi:hypothetical protein
MNDTTARVTAILVFITAQSYTHPYVRESHMELSQQWAKKIYAAFPHHVWMREYGTRYNSCGGMEKGTCLLGA